MNEFNFNGVHEYLDFCTQKNGSSLSDEQVTRFKQEYRTKYLAHMKKLHRATHKTISFSMSKQDYIILQNLAKEQGIKMRDYFFLKLFTKEGHHKVQQTLLPKVLGLIDDVEFAIYEKSSMHLPMTLDILMQIKTLLL